MKRLPVGANLALLAALNGQVICFFPHAPLNFSFWVHVLVMEPTEHAHEC